MTSIRGKPRLKAKKLVLPHLLIIRNANASWISLPPNQSLRLARFSFQWLELSNSPTRHSPRRRRNLGTHFLEVLLGRADMCAGVYLSTTPTPSDRFPPPLVFLPRGGMNRVKLFAVPKMTRCIEWGTFSSIHIAFVLSQAAGFPKGLLLNLQSPSINYLRNR